MPQRSYARSIAMYEEAKRHLAGGVSSNVRYASAPVPLFFECAEGARMIDVDGNSYIDYILGNGPAILGHAPPTVLRAVAETLALGQTYAAQHEREVLLARRLTELLPGLEVVRFATSGTEAVQAAMRISPDFADLQSMITSARAAPAATPAASAPRSTTPSPRTSCPVCSTRTTWACSSCRRTRRTTG